MLTISPDCKTLTQLESLKAPNIYLFSVPLRSIPDASLVHDMVSSAVNSGNRQGIVIVGGGATGVSLGGALSDFIKESKKSDSISITILEALPTILPGWDECLVNKVEEVLCEKGIMIMTSSPVAKVENGGDGESKIHSSLTILTAGVKGYSIPVNPEVERTKDGKIILNEFCQIDRYPNVFSIGDIAAVKD
jgi:NADH:ubiquinone reductase (H+-translocating)